jgi:hypothetical protein
MTTPRLHYKQQVGLTTASAPSCLPLRLQQRHAQVRTALVVFSSGQNPPIPEALVKEGRGERFYTVLINTVAINRKHNIRKACINFLL